MNKRPGVRGLPCESKNKVFSYALCTELLRVVCIDMRYIMTEFSCGYTVKKNPARTEKVEAFCDAFPACGHFYANV